MNCLQKSDKVMCLQKVLLLFRANTLTSPYCFTNAKHHKSNVHNLGLLQTVATANPLPIHQNLRIA